MKELYTIGETSALLAVTVPTLRYYEKVGLLQPHYIDPKTGYRYYTFNQFHYIDRIKYLQKFGLSLDDIKVILHSGSVDKLLPFLAQQKQNFQNQLKEIQATIKDIQWYVDYFTYLNKVENTNNLYKIQLEERYAIAVPCYPDESPISNMEVRLAAAKARPELKNLNYLRQYAYIVDFDKLTQKIFSPRNYMIYLREKPDFHTESLMELPAGEYLCYRARILTEDWDPSVITEFFKDKQKPMLVIANEFEENLVEYMGTQYEIQILL
jgi:DNA-binding transcriptional MerR regulator